MQGMFPKGLKHNIQHLLVSFHSRDKQGKGFLTKQQFIQFTGDFRIPPHISQPKQKYSFHHFLALLSDQQENAPPSCYVHQLIKWLISQKQEYERKRMYQQADAIHSNIREIEAEEYSRRLSILKQVQSRREREFQLSIANKAKEFQVRWETHLNNFQQDSKLLLAETISKCKQELHVRQKSLYPHPKCRSQSKSPPKTIKPSSKQTYLIRHNNYKEAIRVRNSLNNKVVYVQEFNSNEVRSKAETLLTKMKQNHSIIVDNMKKKISEQRLLQLTTKNKQYTSFTHRVKYLTKQFHNQIRAQHRELLSGLNEQFRMSTTNSPVRQPGLKSATFKGRFKIF